MRGGVSDIRRQHLVADSLLAELCGRFQISILEMSYSHSPGASRGGPFVCYPCWFDVFEERSHIAQVSSVVSVSCQIEGQDPVSAPIVAGIDHSRSSHRDIIPDFTQLHVVARLHISRLGTTWFQPQATPGYGKCIQCVCVVSPSCQQGGRRICSSFGGKSHTTTK